MGMQDKATVIFRRLSSGEVIGEIINEAGEVVHSKNLGELTDEEIGNVLQAFRQESPDVNIMPMIQVAGN